MTDADIAELLAIAYASHCANCRANGTEEISYTDFADCYKKYISDFRQEVGAADPYTG